MAVKIRATRPLLWALVFLVAVGFGALRAEAASPGHTSIYDFKYYSEFRPNGTSRLYLPPQEAPATPPITPPPSAPPEVPPPVSSPPSSLPAAQAELRLLELINQARAQAGLAPLQMDPLLQELARKKSQDMVDKGYFSHYSPTYGYAYNMEVRAGIRATYMGAENLGSGPSVDVVHGLLMASPGHRRNILDPRFTDVGIGVVPNSRGVTVTELFIGR